MRNGRIDLQRPPVLLFQDLRTASPISALLMDAKAIERRASEAFLPLSPSDGCVPHLRRDSARVCGLRRACRPHLRADVMLNRSLGRFPSALGTLHRSQPLSSVGRCPRMARDPPAIARSVYHGRRASCAADVFSSPPTAPCAAPLQPFGCTPAPGAAATGSGGRRRSSLLPPLSPDQSELDKAKLRAVRTPCAACVRARCMFVRACACACVGACLCVCVAGCERRKT